MPTARLQLDLASLRGVSSRMLLTPSANRGEQPVKSDAPRDRARAREQEGDKEPRRAPMPWLSQRSRGERIMDMEF